MLPFYLGSELEDGDGHAQQGNEGRDLSRKLGVFILFSSVLSSFCLIVAHIGNYCSFGFVQHTAVNGGGCLVQKRRDQYLKHPVSHLCPDVAGKCGSRC